MKLFTRTEHKITIICEFNNSSKSENAIALLSNYISSIVGKRDIILTDLQSQPAGYRITYMITYYKTWFRVKNYTKELSKLSDWLGNDKNCNGCISRYHYNHV